MASIRVKDLANITGLDLFGDPESFIQDLSEYESDLHGGKAHQYTVNSSKICLHIRPTPLPTPPIKLIE
jgi:hypothetical protein